MRIVARKKRQWKKKVSQKREIIQDRLALAGIDDIDVKVELIQSLIPLGLHQEPIRKPQYQHIGR